MRGFKSGVARWMFTAGFAAVLWGGQTQCGNAQALPGSQPAGALSPPAAASNDSEPLNSDSADRTATMPAAQLITLLRDNPDIMVEVKSMIADAAQQRGQSVQADSLTDEQVYQQITASKELRTNLTQFLRARGYVTEDEIQAAQEQDQVSPTHQPESDLAGMEDLGVANSSATRSALSRQAGTDDLGMGLVGPDQMPQAGTSAQSTVSTGGASRQPQPNITDAPKGMHRPAPYNLPSLRDLYTQTQESHAQLKRFGSDLFVRRSTTVSQGTSLQRSSASASLDVPLGPDYVVGPGDELSISLWGGVSQNVIRLVDREGRVSLPEAGIVQVAGLSMAKVESMITDALQTQYRNAHVSVTVSRLRSIQVFVVGDVQRPGAYEISSLATPLSALFAAGGPTASGSLRVVRHHRNEKQIGEIDLYDFMLHGVKPGDDKLQSGDTLLVPPVGAQVAVSGAVKRPAIYELRDEKDLASVLDDAGGFTVAASLTHITIDRVRANQQREEAAVSVGAQDDPAAIHTHLQATEVRDGDRVRVATVLPYSERAVYLMGHVARPGKIAYRDAMQLKDVLHSYQDLLPEPAEHGEIVRLMAPDLHPETIEFNVQDVLIGNAEIALQPFDTIRIFGRYEVDSPRVSIRGEVQRPGIYPLFEGMTAAQLVRAAGGFKRDALMGKADLASYQVLDGTRVAIERRDVAIGDAVLKADKQADAVLRPGDVLTVHQLTGWNDIGASIVIEGEIAHPGSYGFRQGEHLSDVLRRAGGFRDTAYPEGAVLTRPEVAALEDKTRDELVRQIEASSAAAQMSKTGGSDQGTLQLIQQQQNQMVSRLRSQPSSGRLVIKVGLDIASWAGTAADIEVRTGDVLRVPKRPGFVLISGQVYNPSAITFLPGRTAEWYLQHAGGVTSIADKKQIFVIRANGEVVGRGSNKWYGDGVLATRLNAGDTIVVPQKIIGASLTWRTLLATAQVVSSLAIAGAVAVGL